MNLLINFGLVILFIGNCECKQYDNYTLFRAVPIEDDQLTFFKDLENVYEVNYWLPPGLLYRPVEFTIAPDDKKKLVEEAGKRGIHLETILKDVQKAFDSQTVKAYVRRQMHTFDWTSFYRLGDIYKWLTDLQDGNPEEMTLMKIGTTFEGRDIMAVRVALKGASLKKKVIIEGGIHAREWISPAFVTYLIYHILKAKEANVKLWTVAMSYEWLFVPVINPDGYEYTHEKDRMWRKNRQRYNNSSYGVDINRNFGLHFGTVGVSKKTRSEVFCGPRPFSENESSALAKFVEANKEGLTYYLAFHSFGQYMIIPYAHSKKHYDNYYQVYDLCVQAKEAIKERYNTSYDIGTAYETVGYVVSGGSGCWIKKTFGVPIVVFFELRDRGNYGFALAPDQIEPTCQETLDGLIYLMNPTIVSNLVLSSNVSSFDILNDIEMKDGAGLMSLETVYFVVLFNLVFVNIIVY